MKMVKAAVIFTAALAFGSAFSACNTSAESKLCTCPVKAHLGIGETCPCGGADCDCTLKVYGNLADGTPIYRSGNVSDEEMATAVGNVQAAYASETVQSIVGDITGHIKEIRVVPVSISNSTLKGDDNLYILTIRHNRGIPQIASMFANVQAELVAQVRMDNAIRIARVNAGAPSYQRHGAFLGAGHFASPKGVTRPAVFG